MRFIKMEGLGNDFVVVEADQPVDDMAVATWCDRRRGIGADGVLRVSVDGDGVGMAYWNADGSAAEMCGNGLRCVGLLAHQRGWVDGLFVVQTPAGPRRVKVESSEAITVELGPVKVIDKTSRRVGEHVLYRASVGNPHAVLLVEDAQLAKVADVGSRLETDPFFPERTNVEFAQITDHGVRLRVWERGVGETLACGTGAAATVAVTSLLGLTAARTVVSLPGGELGVEVDEEGVGWITGPARTVFEGELAS